MTDFMPYNEDQELDNNTSDNTHFRDILEQRMSRRSLIKKTASGAAALALASSLSACSDCRPGSRPAGAGTGPASRMPDGHSITGRRRQSGRIACASRNGAW